MRQTQLRLRKQELHLDTVLADTGFSNGENYKYLEETKINGYIPVFGQYEGVREGFTYEPGQDRWRCSQGKYATFRKIKYKEYHPDKLYFTTRRDCKGCPLASACIGKSHEKRISMTVYKDYYDRALERAKSRKGKYYKTLRQSTVEPVFGTLINFNGMRKINTRGIESANKVMVMAAIAYNLKKLLKYRGNNRNHTALMGFKDLLNDISSSLLHNFYLKTRLFLKNELNLQMILILEIEKILEERSRLFIF